MLEEDKKCRVNPPKTHLHITGGGFSYSAGERCLRVPVHFSDNCYKNLCLNFCKSAVSSCLMSFPRVLWLWKLNHWCVGCPGAQLWYWRWYWNWRRAVHPHWSQKAAEHIWLYFRSIFVDSVCRGEWLCVVWEREQVSCCSEPCTPSTWLAWGGFGQPEGRTGTPARVAGTEELGWGCAAAPQSSISTWNLRTHSLQHLPCLCSL